jgi:hypothetical protein
MRIFTSPTRRRSLRCIVAGALVVLTSACATSGYDAGSLQDDLVGVGLTSRQATCVTEGLEDHFDPRRLSSHVDPTAAERRTANRVLAACGVTRSGT